MTRSQRHRFVHSTLPRLLDEDRDGMIARLCAADGGDTLLRVWNRLGEQMPLAERVDPGGLGVDSFRLDDGSVVAFVTLPRPAVAPEAWFVVIWAWPEGPRDGREGPSFEHGYYTLELSEAQDGSPMDVLAQWGHGAHVNFGEAPPSNEGAFLRAVCALRGLPAEQTIQVLLHYLRARTRSIAVGIADSRKITLHGAPSLEVFDRLRRSPSERSATKSTFFQRELEAGANSQWRKGLRIVHRVSDETDMNRLGDAFDSVAKSVEEELERWMQASRALAPPEPGPRQKGWGRPLTAVVATEEGVKLCEQRSIDTMGGSELRALLFESRTSIELGLFNVDDDNLRALLSVLPRRTEEAPLVPETAVVQLGCTDEGEGAFHLLYRLSDELVRHLRHLGDEDLSVVGQRWVSLMRTAGDSSHMRGRGVLVRLVDLARQTGPESPYILIDEYWR